MPFNDLEPQKSRWYKQSWKSHFINNFVDKMANIFISYREYTNYKLALKLKHDDEIIIILGDFFK